MGCDIHLWVEFSEYELDGKPSWDGFGGQFHLGRDYDLFGVLAGVRGPGPAIAEPRGFPDDLGWRTKDESHYYVVDTKEEATESRYVEREKAEDWAKYGAKFVEDGKYITDPDLHSESWLTPEEWNEALKLVSDQRTADFAVGTKYLAITALLKSFTDAGCKARVVFAFDN